MEHDGLRRVPGAELERAGRLDPARAGNGARPGAGAPAGHPGGEATAVRELVAGCASKSASWPSYRL